WILRGGWGGCRCRGRRLGGRRRRGSRALPVRRAPAAAPAIVPAVVAPELRVRWRGDEAQRERDRGHETKGGHGRHHSPDKTFGKPLARLIDRGFSPAPYVRRPRRRSPQVRRLF